METVARGFSDSSGEQEDMSRCLDQRTPVVSVDVEPGLVQRLWRPTPEPEIVDSAKLQDLGARFQTFCLCL